MTKERHIEFHQALHKSLDELVADWIIGSDIKGETRYPSKCTLLEFMAWSKQQTTDPEGEHTPC